MAWLAPNHNLNQWWFPIIEVLWHSPESNFTLSTQATIPYDDSENHTSKIIATSSRGQWVNSSPTGQNGLHFTDNICKCIFSCGEQLYKHSMSVCLSVCLSVTLCLRSPGCNSSRIMVKLGGGTPWAKISAKFVRWRCSSLNERLMS